MKAIKATLLYDGKRVRKNVYVHFDNSQITEISQKKGKSEVIAEGVVTPAFIDAHCHIGMARSGEPSQEDETNEEMNSICALVDALHSVYMDDRAFLESVEHGVLYSHIMPGSGNIIGGRTVLIRNWPKHVDEAYIKHIGIKAALGYNPRSTTSWKGERPSTRMGALAILRNELIKAMKTKALLKKKKKVREEVEPMTEVFMEILDGKVPLMAHVHKEDDTLILLNLMKEFGFKAVVNHGGDFHTPEIWEKIKKAKIPVIYGPVDSFSYKVELKHEYWRNIKYAVESKVDMALMSDHPVVLQRNLFLQLRYFIRFGMSKEEALSLITSRAAKIIGAEKIGEIKKGYFASLVVWNGDPFSLESYPTMVIGEGKVVYEE